MLVVLLVYSVFQVVYPQCSHKMPFVEPNGAVSINYEPNIDYGYDRHKIRQKLNALVGVHFYMYRERRLNDCWGRTVILYRLVEVDRDIAINDYIETVCHELCHLKYNTANERYTQYKTFVTLYESEFRQIALNIAYKMQRDKYSRQYNCLGQIIEYLQ